MKKYVLKRIFISIMTLLLIVGILFILLHLMPGSPFNDEKLSVDQKALLYEKYGLNKSLAVQFISYIKNVFTGDFGVSYSIAKDVPISLLLSKSLTVSLIFALKAVTIGTIIGIILGIVAALKHNTKWDMIISSISVIGVSIPSYVFALLLSYFLGYKIKLFPIIFEQGSSFISSILPITALVIYIASFIMRFTQNEFLNVLGSDYMLFVESKGLPTKRIIFNHALRNSLIPIITVIGPMTIWIMTGSVVIEEIFSIPGIGQMLIKAIQSNDYNVIIALSFVYSAIYIVTMLIVDILYGIIDPRIRLSKGDENE